MELDLNALQELPAQEEPTLNRCAYSCGRASCSRTVCAVTCNITAP